MNAKEKMVLALCLLFAYYVFYYYATSSNLLVNMKYVLLNFFLFRIHEINVIYT